MHTEARKISILLAAQLVSLVRWAESQRDPGQPQGRGRSRAYIGGADWIYRRPVPWLDHTVILNACEAVQAEVRTEFCRRFNLTEQRLFEILSEDVDLFLARHDAGLPHVRPLEDNKDEPS